MIDDKEAEETTKVGTGKPRLVLMGEFSAGKSTLTNILLDCAPLPMRVTATRLPPVKMSYGKPATYAVGLNDVRREIDIEALETVSLEDTLQIEIQMHADVLQMCDILDMPGISDPSMPQEFWEDILDQNDHVIWCTHATQAWRQSEAAVWNTLQEQTSGRNVLLITQFDKLQSARDKARVLKRVEHETNGLFDAVYPISLLDALNAGDDYAVWEKSGAAAFSEHVINLLLEGGNQASAPAQADEKIIRNDLRDTSILREHVSALADAKPVIPRRVVPRQASQGAREPRTASVSMPGE
jgi:hypothetical protein